MLSKPPVLLCMDTSIGPCSVSIGRGEEVIAYQCHEDFHQQSKMLVPMCESVLRDAKLTYADLDAIGATVGPGSFTSIRVGLAVAKATAFALEKPFYGVSTLEVMAHTEKAPDVLSVLDAHRGEAYAQRFGVNHAPLSEASVLPVEAIVQTYQHESLLVTGNAAHKLAALAAPTATWRFSSEQFPDARKVALFIHRALQMEKPVFYSSPIYIRPPDAKIPTPLFS